jgi:hypothetical protein
MAKNNRREAAKKLMEQIDKCEDPKLLIRLTKQLNALRPRRMGRPRTAKSTPSPVTSPESTYIPNGSAMDDLPLGEQTALRVVLALEAEERRRGFAAEQEMTQTDKAALTEETLKTFSDAERDSYECA